MKKYIFHGACFSAFPPPSIAAPSPPIACASMRRVNRYRCGKCPYIYDPRRGDPDGGIPPGTPFERIPNSWRCPVCGASKRDFIPIAAESVRPSADGHERARAVTQVSLPATHAPAQSGAASGSPPSYASETWTVGSLKGRR